MILRTAATLLFSSIALQLSAAQLDEEKIQFLGPLTTYNSIKPNNTARQSKIIQTLLPSLQSRSTSLSVFGTQLKWQKMSDIKALTMEGIQALKFQFSTKRFTQGKLVLTGIKTAHVYLNAELQTGKNEYDIQVPTGDHQVIIIAEQVDNWNEVKIDYTPKAEHDQIVLTNKEQHALSAKQLFDAPTITAISQSPNGQYYLTTSRHYADNTGNTPQTETLLKNEESKILYRFNGVNASSVAWRADSQQLAFVQDQKVTLLNMKDFSTQVIAQNLDGASGFDYFDDNTLIFSWSKSEESAHKLVKHYRGLEDRWSYARANSQIFLLDLNSGLINALTEGKLSHQLEDYNAQRNTILVSRNPQDYNAPPHMLTELLEVHLSDSKQTLLGKYRTFRTAKYAKDGIYLVAGPDFSQGLGRTIPKDMLANNYDGQLYKMDFNGKNHEAFSKQFNPSISDIDVLKNNDVVLKVIDEDKQQLYLFDESKSRFSHIESGLDVVENFTTTSHSKHHEILVTGTQASSPQQLKRITLKNNRVELLWNSKDIAYQYSDVATLDEFNFTNQSGVQIKGRVYLPHDLDKSKKYPALVYYYGGTSPVSRAFTGRYPFNLWAAHGYVVYVLQPTGATGFGQKFSAEHVNAWGEHTAQDIIDGTKAFAQAYPFIDPARIGNLGASYGGFMTMLLATKTDMFSASIAHAGISNITSYWGQGWWGYLYSGEASKNSFPWNNPTLYSQHSPVFHADKVTTPILLLHGDADTNVPPGESHNMYTALKLLGKDVELIEYKGADHQIFARDRRFHWWNTMLAYFDMHLKDEPQWWQFIYQK
ncbi:prolyl oligopeptidase family serine peptidase [Pseudoalteromonas sp. MMG022]|uniref:alpha/beta hydrolase family protein n=1 Tax=Pseudoalteromonas sp. MMG022 TaxID=2909978 RepID=UPI001F031BA6|nr:prolyl oligopeptidase family serine peptidase [Pseudoalteromonas sp. MMG022]MCF6434813.1 prolyl oligopeptidase family serine peptidase [Pseudoalteromonas sp. MMG022]